MQLRLLLVYLLCKRLQLRHGRVVGCLRIVDVRLRHHAGGVQLALAIQLDRERKLSAAGVVPKADVDNAQTAYDAAVAQLKALTEQVNQQQVELRYYRVAGPMDGIFGDIPGRVGERVAVTTLPTTGDERGPLETDNYGP